jgi:hypothetical protein
MSGELLIVCTSGPHEHTWFTEEDWNKLLIASVRMNALTGSDYPALHYYSTGDLIDHPSMVQADGKPVKGRELRYASGWESSRIHQPVQGEAQVPVREVQEGDVGSSCEDIEAP